MSTKNGWELLLKELKDKEDEVIKLRRREITLLTELLQKEDMIHGLTRTITELKYPKGDETDEVATSE